MLVVELFPEEISVLFFTSRCQTRLAEIPKLLYIVCPGTKIVRSCVASYPRYLFCIGGMG